MISGRLVQPKIMKQDEQPFFSRIKPDFALQNKLQKPKVLVVDDEPHILKLLSLTLRKNFDVITANTPNEAIYKARLESPHLILSDVLMPNMSGQELCNELKKFKETRHIPFMFLTALSGSGHKLRSLGTDADDYITKPFDPAELVSKIRSNLFS